LKTNKKIICLVVSIFIFISIIPAMYNVEARNELSLIQDGEKGQRIVVYQPETMSIQTFEWSHVLHGFIYTEDEKHEWQDAEVKLYIDEIEIELDTKTESERIDGVKTYSKWFYEAFETDYFAPGIYNWTVIWINNDEIFWRSSHPLTVLTNGHQLIVYNQDTMIISASERSFVRHGWTGVTETDYDLLQPFDVQVFLDDVEIELYYVRDEIASDPEPIYNIWFYQTFDPNYFTVGGHKWQVIWTDNTGVVWEQTSLLTVVDDGQRLLVYEPETMVITDSMPCFVRHGWYMIVDLNDLIPTRPYNVELYINGVLESLQDQIRYTPENPEDVYQLYWYKYYEPGHFAPGEYEWHVIWYEDSVIVWDVTHVLIVLEDCHRLSTFNPESLYITTTQRSYIRHGWSFTDPSEIYDNLPLSYELYIDNVQEELYFYFDVDYSGEDPEYRYLWYQSFDSGYFEPGTVNFVSQWKRNGAILLEHQYPFTVVEDGVKLDILGSQDPLTIRKGQRCFVMHGWVGITIDTVFDGPFDFQLFIDGIEQDLCKNIELDFSGEEIIFSFLYYINFDSFFTFDIGVYEFKGIWTAGTEVYERTKQIIVIDNGHFFWGQSTEDQLTWFGVEIHTTDKSFSDNLPVNLELYIDGTLIDLQISYWIDTDPDSTIWYIWSYYAQFEAYHFYVGWHTIRVVETKDNGMIIRYDKTWDFEVISAP